MSFDLFQSLLLRLGHKLINEDPGTHRDRTVDPERHCVLNDADQRKERDRGNQVHAPVSEARCNSSMKSNIYSLV